MREIFAQTDQEMMGWSDSINLCLIGFTGAWNWASDADGAIAVVPNDFSTNANECSSGVNERRRRIGVTHFPKHLIASSSNLSVWSARLLLFSLFDVSSRQIAEMKGPDTTPTLTNINSFIYINLVSLFIWESGCLVGFSETFNNHRIYNSLFD